MNDVKNILELKNRKKLYTHIANNPGIYLNEIFRDIANMNKSTIRYHIEYLLKHGYIDCKKINGYNHYFTKETSSSDKKIMMSFIRKTTPRIILLYLIINFGATQIELSKELEKTPTSISFHLKRLEKSGIIEPVSIIDGKIQTNLKNIKYINFKTDGKKVYKITNPYKVYDLIDGNKEKFKDTGMTKFLLDYIQKVNPKTPPEEYHNWNKSFEIYEDVFYEIFPHWFYG